MTNAARRLAVVCGAALAASALLSLTGSDAYAAVLGITHPVAWTGTVLGLGFAGWIILARRSWIPADAGGLAGYGPALAFGLALPIPIILVDYHGGFPADINARLPDAILFYPSIAVLAELVFHVAPLAAAALLANAVRLDARVPEMAGLAAAVLIEPILQVPWGAGGSPVWANAYVGVHLLAFNAIGVYLLRRYGILRTVSYRLSYYLVWHIGWGYLRLSLLFGG